MAGLPLHQGHGARLRQRAGVGLWRAVGADGEPLPITAASAKPTAAPAPAKAAPAKGLQAAGRRADQGPGRPAEGRADQGPAVAPTTVRDAPGTSSTD